MMPRGWARLAPREQRLVLAAAWLVGLALAWWVLVKPALAVLATAPARHAKLDAEIQQMQRMRAQAASLQTQAALPADEARRQLETSVRQSLGTGASVAFAGDRATVTLRGVAADVLPVWLAQARANARSLPVEMRLARSSAAPQAATWDGSVIMALPPR